MKTCFFIGHRDAPDSVATALAAAVEHHIVEYGVTEFIVGHYGGFDRMATRAVTEAKQANPQVQLFQRLTHLLACRADTRPSSLTSAFWPFSSPNPLILLVYKYSPVSLILFSQMSMLSLLLEILQ